MNSIFKKYYWRDFVSIGKGKQCDIIYNADQIDFIHVEIRYYERQIISNSFPFINNKKITEFEYFKPIFLLDLVIIPCKEFIMINSPNNLEVNLKIYNIVPKFIKHHKEINYINQTPRFLSDYPKCDIKFLRIDKLQKTKKMPLFFVIAPTLLMSIASLGSGLLSGYNSYLQGRSLNEIIPIVILPSVMILSIIIYQPIYRLYEKKENIKSKNERFKKIDDEINRIVIKIEEYYKDYLVTDNQRSFSMADIYKKTLNRDSILFSKKIYHNDYLKLTLGYSKVKSRINFSNLPELDDTYYLNKAKLVIDYYEYFQKSWNYVDLINTNHFAIASINNKWLNYILLQISAFYSFDELEIVLICNKKFLKENLYLYKLPHLLNCMNTWNIATSRKDINNYINHDNNQNKIYIIQELFGLDNEVLGDKKCIYIVDDEYKVPWWCSEYLIDDKESFLVNNCGRYVIDFVDDEIDIIDALDSIYKVRIKSSYLVSKRKTTFNDLYSSKIDKNMIKDLWKKKKESLSVPIGFYENNEILNLDLHESHHGPHMMIGASTGAGKSEFIITYLLSLALNFSYEFLQFAIIDFKGGGLSDSLKYKGNYIPHIVGTLTNLEQFDLQRVLVSLDLECKRRQKLFNDMKNLYNINTINIDEYQKVCVEKKQLQNIAHLFIVVDEFAQLKVKAPEFIKELIAISRIGRSLGIHLILSTQKPSVAIDGEIWSNTRCKICLRVQERQDSIDMIKNDKASKLKNPGEFYMLYDQKEERATSAWANALSMVSDDCSTAIVNYQGNPIKALNKNENATQLMSIVKNIVELEESGNDFKLWHSSKIDIENIPHIKDQIILGKVDNYYDKTQPWLYHSFKDYPNSVIYTLDLDEKRVFFDTIMYNLMNISIVFDIVIVDFSSIAQKYQDKDNITILKNKEKIENYFSILLNNFEKNDRNRVIIILHYPKFHDEQENWIHLFIRLLRDGSVYNTYFIIFTTTASTIPYRYTQFIKRSFCLHTNSKKEINTIFETSCSIDEVKKGYGLINGKKILRFKLLQIKD
ncbi:MAG: FtsK/SpoIIIE domain-containing protein [Anaerorhabdus sp.]